MRVLATGATGGLGRAVAEQLVKEGALVRASSRNPAAAEMPAGTEIVSGDLNDPSSMGAPSRERCVPLCPGQQTAGAHEGDEGRRRGIRRCTLDD